MIDDPKPAEPGAHGGGMRQELMASLDSLLDLLRAVTKGELQQRATVDYPETHPVGALAVSANTMIDALVEAKKHSEEYSADLAERLATIERQEQAIQELSTPVIEVWPGVLCVPVIGSLSDSRATLMTRTLLATIVQKKSPLTIIDITGVDSMDARAADNFIRMARSVRLLGAKCVISGVHPNIARTLVRLGIDLAGIQSFRTTREALRTHVRAKKPRKHQQR
jgi:rsbT co-antagonist protein RsbR